MVLDGSVALKWVSTSRLMCVLLILRQMAGVLALVLLYAKSLLILPGVKYSAWGKLTRAASLLSAILLFAVTLENFTFRWATVIIWFFLGESRLWSPLNPRLMTQVMRVKSVWGGGLRSERALLIFMRLLWSHFSPCSIRSSLLE